MVKFGDKEIPIEHAQYWPSVRCDRLNNSSDRSRSSKVNCPSIAHKIVAFSETVRNCSSPVTTLSHINRHATVL